MGENTVGGWIAIGFLGVVIAGVVFSIAYQFLELVVGMVKPEGSRWTFWRVLVLVVFLVWSATVFVWMIANHVFPF